MCLLMSGWGWDVLWAGVVHGGGMVGEDFWGQSFLDDGMQ